MILAYDWVTVVSVIFTSLLCWVSVYWTSTCKSEAKLSHRSIFFILFLRNGKCLGTAFDRVQLGPSYGYFPAVSLSLSENLRANFGATPLRYPLEGYRPLQDPPMMDLVAAQQLFGYLERLLPSFAQV